MTNTMNMMNMLNSRNWITIQVSYFRKINLLKLAKTLSN
jgi:hypothetical protein